MSLRTDLYQSRSKINFLPIWAKTVPISAAVALFALILLLVVGLNKSIDFEGGGIFEAPISEDIDVEKARDAVSAPNAVVQILEGSDGGFAVRVKTGAVSPAESDQMVAELAELGGVSVDDVSINTVGPTWGDQISAKAQKALLVFFVIVAIYLAWTLEWRMAIGALIAVVHDLLITAGVYAAFRFEVSPATVIALLTIMGYSLYDTVVVYDKVLENELERGSRKDGYTALVNRSMNQVLMRSVNTTITTVLPVFSMLVIGGIILGGGTLRGFSVALFIGLILGTYSSLFLAAPLLAWLKEREDEELAEENLREKRRLIVEKERTVAERHTGEAI